jgi:hypothetical protein
MPESIRICGEPIAPADRMILFADRAATRTNDPMATAAHRHRTRAIKFDVLDLNIEVKTVRFGRDLAGLR